MKYRLLLSFLIFSIALVAQERGVSPLPAEARSAKAGVTYAVVIGISDYQDKDIPDLRFADRDAEAFANFLRSPAGGALDGDHLKLLTNEQATLGQFDAALWWLVDECKAGDNAIIYFSGHGDVERRSISQPGFLLCWDAPPHAYTGGGTYSVFFLKDIVSTLSVQNKVRVTVITDACRSGKLAGSAIDGAHATAANLAILFANEVKILSCQPDEYSIEGEQWGGGRGAFSYHLLDGLYGLADADQDGAVTLKEIGRYLEDHVSSEVAPENQNPMTIGNKTEKLVAVFPEVLEQIQQGKKGQMTLFTATDSRGIEAETLAAADSTIAAQYAAFKQALADKRFLEPAGACAEYYYEILSKEPQLERLHASMRRNYAAALQDDAQQMLNTLLKGGFTKKMLTGDPNAYIRYPAQLAKAIELLGKQHYMYPLLEARRYYFLADSCKNVEDQRKALYTALQFQPDMPQALSLLIRTYPDNADSAEYYCRKALAAAPGWNFPYLMMAGNYLKIKDWDKALFWIDQALQADSSYIVAKNFKAISLVYSPNPNYPEAEKLIREVLDNISDNICSPCATGLLVEICLKTNRKEEAFAVLVNMTRQDSLSAGPHNALGWFCIKENRLTEAEAPLLKAISLDSSMAFAYANLGLVYAKTGRYQEAVPLLEKGLALDPNNAHAIYMNYAILYSHQNLLDKAFDYLEKAFKAGYDYSGFQHLDIKHDPSLQPLRAQTERWRGLIEKYYPGQDQD